jgi:hypothetical protein
LLPRSRCWSETACYVVRVPPKRGSQRFNTIRRTRPPPVCRAAELLAVSSTRPPRCCCSGQVPECC